MEPKEIRAKTLSNWLLRAGLILSILLAISVLPLTLPSGFSDCVSAEARTKQKSKSSAKTPPATKKKSYRELHREEKAARKHARPSRDFRGDPRSSHTSARETRSSKRGSKSSKRERGSSSHREKNARTSKSAHRGRHHEEVEERQEKAADKPPPPSPEQVEANSKRESSYQTMARAYKLYDEGINARIPGDFNTAVGKLTESSKLFNDTRGYQRTGESSLQEALVHYELGQAYEGRADILSARDSYVRCLNIRPTMVDASVRLVSMLATAGQWQLAIAKAQDAVRTNPVDPRVHQLMALTLGKTGHPEEAQAEALKAQQMLKVVPKYKPMGMDAVWRRTHKEDGTPITESETGVQEEGGAPKKETGKSDVDNPDDVMGVEKDKDDDDD